MTEDEFNEVIASMNRATSVCLHNRKIGDAEARVIAHALENNTTVTSIDLSRNKFSKVGAKAIAHMLERNTTLTSIDLEDNKISDAVSVMKKLSQKFV